MLDKIFNDFGSSEKKRAKEVVDEIEKLWYAHELSDTKGFIEVKPKMASKKHFRTIEVYLKNGTCKKFELSTEEFKAYKVYKLKMLGVE